MNRAIIYFGNDLPREEFRDKDIRDQKLKAGLALATSITGVEIISTLRSACAAIVEVSESSTEQLRAVLESTSSGRISVNKLDRSMFRPAGGAEEALAHALAPGSEPKFEESEQFFFENLDELQSRYLGKWLVISGSRIVAAKRTKTAARKAAQNDGLVFGGYTIRLVSHDVRQTETGEPSL